MKGNPFLSDTFTSIWSKHFNKSKRIYSFNFIHQLHFFKHPWLPLYLNIGKNHTKGISYSLTLNNIRDLKKKVLIIYDVPTYFDLNLNAIDKKVKLTKIKQYPGFLVELDNYPKFEQYFIASFSKSSRYKLNKYKKRLESCFNISYKMYCGQMDRGTYDNIFKEFRNLLIKRFNDKGTTNNNLHPKEWDFYHEVAFPLILEKKAALYVIYNNNTPIGVTLNYLSNTAVFDAITVFDIDYEKFHLGSVTVLKLIEWSIDNGYRYFDFSKGYFDYKKRWASKEYNFEYHLYYDHKSIRAKIIATFISRYFKLKNYLRNRNINTKLHNLTFWLKTGKSKKKERKKHHFSPIAEETVLENFKEINRSSDEFMNLRTYIFEFLYLNTASEDTIKVKKNILENNQFILESDKKRVLLSLL